MSFRTTRSKLNSAKRNQTTGKKSTAKTVANYSVRKSVSDRSHIRDDISTISQGLGAYPTRLAQKAQEVFINQIVTRKKMESVQRDAHVLSA